MYELKEVINIKTGMTQYYYRKSLEKLKDCTTLTKITALNLIAFLNENLKNCGMFIISQGYRTKEQQEKLYNQGRRTPGKIVTNADGVVNKSAHQLGIAFDIAVIKGANVDYSIETWAKVVTETKKFKILFEQKYKKYELALGSEWKTFRDLPHFEIRKKED